MAGRIPQDFLDQLLGRVDLVEVIDARISLRKAGRDFVACCPFHSEKTPSFTVSPSKQFYHCFGCGAHGTAISFLMEYEHLPFVEAVEELARSVGIDLPHGPLQATPGEDGDLIAVTEQADRFFRRQLREHTARDKAIAYLRRRGLSGETVKAYGIGYAPPGWDGLVQALTGHGTAVQTLIAAGLAIEGDKGGCRDRFRDRIMFPIRDRRGRTIAFGGRTLDEATPNTPKYLNSPETAVFHKGRELYGLYEARMSERQLRRLLVVEGYMDVIALAQHGLRYAVATLGTATTAEHLERLFRVTKDVIFCFDGDRAGREAAWRALENVLPLLRDGRQAGFLFLPEGEDPDSLVRKEGGERFEQCLTQAQPLSDYFFNHLTRGVDMGSLDGRARLVEQTRPLIARLPDGVFRDMMLQRLADTAGASRTGIASRLPSSRPEPAAARPPGRDLGVTRTPLRLAIALLLNATGLAQQVVDVERLKGIAAPGMPLLVELIELLKACPHINAAAVLERYRDSETGRILERLAQFRPEIPEHLYAAEFFGILEHLERHHSVQKQLLEQAVIQKGNLGDLSERERQMLLKLHMAHRVKE